jgi:hypothetical protein
VTIALLLIGVTQAEQDRAIGDAAPPDLLLALRWLVPAAMAGLFARKADWKERDSVAEPFAVLLLYVAIAQLLPPALLPLVPALLLVGLAVATHAGDAGTALRARSALQPLPALLD